MEKIHILVVSKTPPGGRCEFYDKVFFELVKAYENVYYTLIEDGLLLTPEEIVDALKRKGAIPRLPEEEIKSRLTGAYEEFIGGV